MGKRVDITGKRYGNLIVQMADETVKRPNGRYRASWICLCDCGNTITAWYDNLIAGRYSSCGCAKNKRIGNLRKTHGLSSTREHNAWRSMIFRCHKENNGNGNRNYGERGISVCDRWLERFEAFLEDMGPCPDGLTLERIDNNKGYEPGNCRWATWKEQHRNKRTNRMLTAFGKTQCLAAWAEDTGIAYLTIFYRLKRGWPIEKAVTP